MKDDGDVFGVLGWGLRTYGWLVVVSVLALGLLVPAILQQVPDEYEARAQVGPTEALKLPNLDPLPRVGESVFNNGVVAEAVRESIEPAIDPSVSVIPKHVELVAAQDNIVFTVIGHATTPRAAERIANIAAATFTQELNKYAQPVGSFAIQRLATTPTQPVPKAGGLLSIGIGVLAGLIAGVGAVALLLVWRRPVLDAASVQRTTGAPVFGRILLGGPQDSVRGLPRLCRRVLSGPTDMLLIAGPRNTRRDRHRLADELTSVLERTRRQLLIIDAPTQLEVATRPESSLTLLVVHEGIPQSVLHRQAEQYLDGGAAGVVLVRTPRWSVKGWWRRLRRSRPASGEPRTVTLSPPSSVAD